MANEMTEAEAALLALAVAQTDDYGGYGRNNPLAKAARAVVEERIQAGAREKYAAAYRVYLEARYASRKCAEDTGLPEWVTDEIRATVSASFYKELAAAKAAKYHYTGVTASEDTVDSMKQVMRAPVIAIHGKLPDPAKFVHQCALAAGLPDIKGFYGYDFKRGEFICLKDALGSEPDAWRP